VGGGRDDVIDGLNGLRGCVRARGERRGFLLVDFPQGRIFLATAGVPGGLLLALLSVIRGAALSDRTRQVRAARVA